MQLLPVVVCGVREEGKSTNDERLLPTRHIKLGVACHPAHTVANLDTLLFE
jgi:hypothetical protein